MNDSDTMTQFIIKKKKLMSDWDETISSDFKAAADYISHSLTLKIKDKNKKIYSYYLYY